MVLQFDDEYFNGEWREDFYIEGMMKRAWAAQLKMLKEIDAVCRRNHLRYFADSGTLLGAIRHKGFIPWDDDIDISMPREDYDKFWAIAPRELPAEWLIGHAWQNEDWRKDISRVCNGNIVGYGKERLEEWYGCPYIVGIDIFPIDNMPGDKAEEDVWVQMMKLLIQFWGWAEDMKDMEARESLIRQVEELCKVKIDRDKLLQNELARVLDTVSGIYRGEKTEEVTNASWFSGHPNYRLKREWFEESIEVPFENITIPVPRHYDEVLSVMYGDWHVPVRYGAMHDYPFYKAQQQLLDEVFGEKNEGN